MKLMRILTFAIAVCMFFSLLPAQFVMAAGEADNANSGPVMMTATEPGPVDGRDSSSADAARNRYLLAGGIPILLCLVAWVVIYILNKKGFYIKTRKSTRKKKTTR